MKRPLIFVSLIAFCTLTTTTVQAQDVPFVGIITQDNTPLRAGAGQPFYVVGELKSGDRVMVREVIVGWHRIDAPQGVFSYVSKMNVDAQGDGRTGTVNANRTPVTAARSRGTGPSYQTQVELKQGDTVSIVGEQGSFYKITPPASATVFLAPGSVRPATQAEIRAFENNVTGNQVNETQVDAQTATEVEIETNSQEPVSDNPTEVERNTNTEEQAAVTTEVDQTVETTVIVEEKVQTPETKETLTTTTVVETVEETTATQEEPDVEVVRDMVKGGEEPAVVDTEDLSQLEARMLPLFMKPVEEQPIDEMVLAYKQLQSSGELTPSDQRIIAMRLVALERNRKLASALRDIAEARRAAEAGSQASVELQRKTEVEIQQAAEQPPSRYDLVGRLTGSSVYNGRDLPVLFRLTDAGTGRTIGYLHPNEIEKHKALLGRRVGIIGDVTFDPALQINLIHVDRIAAVD